MASDRASNDPRLITEFASDRYFEKLNQLNRDAAQSSTDASQARFILPIRTADPQVNKSPRLPNRKHLGPRSLRHVHPRQSESSLFKSSPVGPTAKQSGLSLDRFFRILPRELHIQIITLLPISDLLNLRVASRWWHTLITLNEIPIAGYHLDHYIPAYAQRLYPITKQSSLSLHHICALWHRHHVAAKLSYLMCEWIAQNIFLRQTNVQQNAFAPQKERMRRRLTWLLFHIFHFFETYRTIHLEYIKRQGHGLKREPYTLNPIETQVMAMYDDNTLLRMHEVFPLVISSFCRRLRPPTYVGRVERSLRGYIREAPSNEVTVAILCIGGLGQVARLWGIKGYNSRRSAVDEWYAGIIKDKDQVKPGLGSGKTSMKLGNKPALDEGPVQGLKVSNPSPEATSNSYEDTSLVFNTSMVAGMPMGALNSEQLETLLPDLPALTQIWLTTAEALVIKSEIVERAVDIKRNQQVMLDLIMEENEEDHDDERWYGRSAPELVGNLAETMRQSLLELDQDTDHSESSTAQKKPNLEVPQPKEERESTLAPFSRIALCWYALMRILDRPPTNSKRVTYRCGCGDLRYLDVEELVPGGADELQEILRADAQAVRQRGPVQDTSSSNLPTSPPEVHLTPLGQRNSQAHDQPAQGSRSQGPSEPRLSDKSSTNRTGMLPTRQKQLIVCINTKRGLVTPQHLDVSSVTNDQYLFESIKTAYSEVRREQEWNLAALFSRKINIPSWILKLLSITPPKHIQLPSWLIYHLQRCTFFIPKKAEFVQFQLMPVRKEIFAGNLVKPEVPGYEEVTVKRTYEYRPVPLKVKIISIPFLHELLGPGEHLGLFWWNRFPKKLDGALVWDEDADCMGWGIHITEGWNKPLILVLALLLMSLFGIFVIVYSVLTHDGSTGAGIGSFLMAFLTLYCWLRYEGWKSG